MSERDVRIVCEGSFAVDACGVSDQVAGGADAVALNISSKGFQATPRGLGFVLGSLVSWYLNKVEERIPASEREAVLAQMRFEVLTEVHKGMAQALIAGEIIPPLQ